MADARATRVDDLRRMESEALRAVRALSPALATPTLVLLALLYFTGALSTWAGLTGRLPLALMFVINTLVAYGAYTPLHEALHDNIAKGRLRALTPVVGVAASWLFLHNYALQRATHLSHHANLNDPKRDADHWVAGKSPLSVALRCLTIVVAHYAVGWRIAPRGVRLRAVLENGAVFALVFAAGAAWGAPFALVAFVGPALLGSMLLGLLFDYAVHAPHEKGVTERFENTRVYLFPRGFEPLGSWLWGMQNYHLIHHLYPGVPFYAYGRAFALTRPLLEARGAPIIRLGLDRSRRI